MTNDTEQVQTEFRCAECQTRLATVTLSSYSPSHIRTILQRNRTIKCHRCFTQGMPRGTQAMLDRVTQ